MQVESFLQDIDRHWGAPGAAKICLRVIGSSALLLQTQYARGTRDSDILETAQLSGDVGARLVALAGPGSDIARQHGLYVEIIPSGLPFLPQAPSFHPLVKLNASLKAFHVDVLDVVDVVVSKLKRFHANDRSDIAAMVERGLVSHEMLVRRFEAAVDAHSLGAGADDLPRFVANLNQVERDAFGVEPTAIELPSWV